MKPRLGRRAVKRDTRTLLLSRYLNQSVLPAPPTSVDWTKDITDFGVLLNNELGDCTCAGVAHAAQIWTANNGAMANITDAAVLDIYERWCGYNPVDPASDCGGIELDILCKWKAQGFDGHTLTGFADPDVTNLMEIQQAIYLFGGLYIGMSVPNFIMNSSLDSSTTWDVQPADGIAGGHCVYVCGYDQAQQIFRFISWGKVYSMTVAFWRTYVDESHALVSPDWAGTKTAPSGLDLAGLTEDLNLIR